MPQASLHFRLLEDYRSTTSPSLLPPFGARQREGMAASDSRRGGSLRLRSTCPAAPFGPTDSETKPVQVSEVPGNGCGRVKTLPRTNARTHAHSSSHTHPVDTGLAIHLLQLARHPCGVCCRRPPRFWSSKGGECSTRRIAQNPCMRYADVLRVLTRSQVSTGSGVCPGREGQTGVAGEGIRQAIWQRMCGECRDELVRVSHALVA